MRLENFITNERVSISKLHCLMNSCLWYFHNRKRMSFYKLIKLLYNDWLRSIIFRDKLGMRRIKFLKLSYSKVRTALINWMKNIKGFWRVKRSLVVKMRRRKLRYKSCKDNWNFLIIKSKNDRGKFKPSKTKTRS